MCRNSYLKVVLRLVLHDDVEFTSCISRSDEIFQRVFCVVLCLGKSQAQSRCHQGQDKGWAFNVIKMIKFKCLAVNSIVICEA